MLRPASKPAEITLKDGVELDADGQTAMATIAGKVVFERNTLSIREVVEIKGDVDFETGNLDLVIDGTIHGNIRDLFQVKTKKSLTVDGAIEAADVQAEGDVTVRGGILNRGKGQVIAGGQIVDKFCDEADLRAEGDIRLTREAMNSHIHTSSRLILDRGSVIGGHVYAQCGVEAHTLASEVGVSTETIVGRPADAQEEIETPPQVRVTSRIHAYVSVTIDDHIARTCDQWARIVMKRRRTHSVTSLATWIEWVRDVAM